MVNLNGPPRKRFRDISDPPKVGLNILTACLSQFTPKGVFAPGEFHIRDNSSVEGDLNERVSAASGLEVDDVDSDADDPDDIFSMIGPEW